MGLSGWARNEPDGTVTVYAVGTPQQLNRLTPLLREGSRVSEVHSVQMREAAVQQLDSFQTR